MYRGEYTIAPGRTGFIRRTASTTLTVLRNEGMLALAIKIACVADVPIDAVLARFWWRFDTADSRVDLPVVWVRPDDVCYDKTFPFPVRWSDAVVGIGTRGWDSYRRPFEDTPVYRSLRDRFVDGCDWEDTPKYRQSVAELNVRETTWNGCRTRDEIDARCARIDRLYRMIRDEGYRSQQALYAAAADPERDDYTKRVGPWIVPDELRIAIGRDGELIRCACARHRLSIAQLLGIDMIPAVVQLVHAGWDGTLTARFDRLDRSGRLRRVSDTYEAAGGTQHDP